MKRADLEAMILDYMKNLYKASYIGFIEVIQKDDEYSLTLGIPSYMTLTSISMQSDKDEDFLSYIYEELRTRNYIRNYFYKVVKEHEKH